MKTIAKASYIIYIGSLCLLSSCAQEELPDVPAGDADRRIVFHTALPGLASRAEEATSDLPYFYLTAFDETDPELQEEGKVKEYFDSVKIEKPTGADKVISDQCIWPAPGQEADLLHFFAYYPELPASAELVNATSVVDDRATIAYNINDYTIQTDIADQVDFITAYTTGSMADNLFSGISLGFQHQLSRIEVLAKGSSKTFKLEIAGVRFGGMPTKADFVFSKNDEAGKWIDISEKKVIEYIYRPGDKIVSINNQTDELSIMGEGRCAMLFPSKYAGWDYTKDAVNNNEGMYLGVLLRVLDKTPTGNDKQQYPYFDNSQGLNAMNIPIVYLAVDNDGNVTANPGQLYKSDAGQYFTDEAMTDAYTAPDGSTVKEFGWAHLPVTADWRAGYTCAYILDYTSGVGLHGPEVPGDVTPKAGDPVISDRVGVSMSVKNWNNMINGSVTVPGS